MDIAVEKLAKYHLNQQFSQWYLQQVLTQLGGVVDMEELGIQPINLSMSAMTELSSNWLVNAVNYPSHNPGIIVNEFTGFYLGNKFGGEV